jgi:hypothetical protein
MAPIEQVGQDEVLGRDLFLLSIPSPQDMPHRLAVTTAKFACLIAWDARSARVEELSAIARQLLDAGAVYVCAWGPGCERVHDIFDEERDGPNPLTSTDPVVMTTWHDDESLAEALGLSWQQRSRTTDSRTTAGRLWVLPSDRRSGRMKSGTHSLDRASGCTSGAPSRSSGHAV